MVTVVVLLAVVVALLALAAGMGRRGKRHGHQLRSGAGISADVRAADRNGRVVNSPLGRIIGRDALTKNPHEAEDRRAD